jgi:hypothetical protein
MAPVSKTDPPDERHLLRVRRRVPGCSCLRPMPASRWRSARGIGCHRCRPVCCGISVRRLCASHSLVGECEPRETAFPDKIGLPDKLFSGYGQLSPLHDRVPALTVEGAFEALLGCQEPGLLIEASSTVPGDRHANGAAAATHRPRERPGRRVAGRSPHHRRLRQARARRSRLPHPARPAHIRAVNGGADRASHGNHPR